MWIKFLLAASAFRIIKTYFHFYSWCPCEERYFYKYILKYQSYFYSCRQVNCAQDSLLTLLISTPGAHVKSAPPVAVQLWFPLYNFYSRRSCKERQWCHAGCISVRYFYSRCHSHGTRKRSQRCLAVHTSISGTSLKSADFWTGWKNGNDISTHNVHMLDSEVPECHLPYTSISTYAAHAKGTMTYRWCFSWFLLTVPTQWAPVGSETYRSIFLLTALI